MDKDIEKMLSSEAEQLKRLQNIVKKTIEEESLIVENLLHQPKEVLTTGQSISDKVARFGGSWNFIIAFGVILFLWISILRSGCFFYICFEDEFYIKYLFSSKLVL